MNSQTVTFSGWHFSGCHEFIRIIKHRIYHRIHYLSLSSLFNIEFIIYHRIHYQVHRAHYLASNSQTVTLVAGISPAARNLSVFLINNRIYYLTSNSLFIIESIIYH